MKRSISVFLLIIGCIALLLPILAPIFNLKKTTGNTSQTSNTTTPPQQNTPSTTVSVPDFNADSAFLYVQKQVDFGPRVPASPTHKACADWLTAQMRRLADTVQVQTAKVKVHNGKEVPMYNIIASLNPEANRRILLCAHWDTRPIADQDNERSNEPILGANDGASGVGVLMEIARQMKAADSPLGLDLIFFDVEDYGLSDIEDSYCLGSQYWAKHLHTPNYKPEYGILLDMVGAPDAVFLKEQWSMQFAPSTVDKVWKTAAELGYNSYFVNQMTNGSVTDDHYYVNKLASIPTIDIIHYTPEGRFGAYWHTHDDDMKAVSKNTLDAVGTVLLTVLFREAAVI